MWMSSSMVVLGIALYSMTVNSPNFRRDATSSLTERKPQVYLHQGWDTHVSMPKGEHAIALPQSGGARARPWEHLHLRTPTPQAPTSPPTRQSTHLRQKNMRTNITTMTTTPLPKPRTGPAVTKAKNIVLRRMLAAPPAKRTTNVVFSQNCILSLWNTSRKNPTFTAPPTSQVGVHAPNTRAPPGV